MIRSTMQEFPLTIPAIMRHGTSVYGASECVTWTGAAPRRASYAQVGQNAGRLARALARLGIRPNDPVATFCWNNQEHLEAYFGVPGMGAVLHTLNIRLPGAQVAQIINHASDRIIIVDDSLVPLLAKIADELPTVEAFNWAFVAEIPKTAVGKFDKKVLRSRDAAGDLAIERVSR